MRICLPTRREGMHDWPCSWAGPGFSRVLPSPTNSLSRKGPIRSSQRRKPWIGIQKRKHYQHPHLAEAPDKGQDQAKNGREGRKYESSVQRIYNCLSSSRSQPFCLSLLFFRLDSVLMFHDFNRLTWLLESCSFGAEKGQGARQLSSSIYLKEGLLL